MRVVTRTILLLLTLCCCGARSQDATILVDPSIQYQTISGWEATTQAGQDAAAFGEIKKQLFDLAVNDLGINRLRLEIRSGAENSEQQSPSGMDPRYFVINDNSDPYKINWNGFVFEDLGKKIQDVVLPMKTRLEERGEKLFLNLNYVNFKGSTLHRDNPEEYAEFIQASFLHIQKQYNWVPDGVEVILEPDNAGWSGTQVGEALIAAAKRLELAGFHPAFTAPSTANMTKAIQWFEEMMRLPDARKYLTEFSYHRYKGTSEASLRSIAELASKYKVQTAMLEHIGSGFEDLHQDLKTGKNSAWQQYTLAYYSRKDNGGHYYRFDEKNGKVREGSRTKFLKQYFRYVRRGAVRIEAQSDHSAFDPIAFRNSDGRYVVIVKSKRGGTLKIAGLRNGNYGIRYTTAKDAGVDLTTVPIQSDEVLKTEIPDGGVITIYGRK